MKLNLSGTAALISAALGLLVSADLALAADGTWLPAPATGDWNTGGNWSSGTPPNGPADTATFGNSSLFNVSLSANTEVNSILFTVSAPIYIITASPTTTLTLSGVGITNNSAATQFFVTDVNAGGQFGQIHFENSATAGSAVVFTNNGSIANNAIAGITNFYGNSSAGDADFVNNGGDGVNGGGGSTQFIDVGTSAANGVFINYGAFVSGSSGGSTNFLNGTAANATITNNGGSVVGAGQGRTLFQNSATAANATITSNGGNVAGATGGSTEFLDTSTAGNSTVTANGGTAAGAGGGLTLFSADAGNILNSSTAGNATLIANGGANGGDGGSIRFIFFSTGGTARAEVFGNGNLDISPTFASAGVSIGSIEGDGNVFLGSKKLTVGTNNLDTTFSGVIQDGGSTPGVGGSLTKVGTGTLTLSHDNTFTGAFDIENGTVAVDSLFALGAGNVTVNGGLLRSVTGNETFVVQGNYVQNTGGTLRIGIGRYAGLLSSDTLEANGTGSLSGTLQLVNVNGFTPANGDRVTILTDNGGHTGVFDTVTSNFTGLLRPVVHYDEALDIYVQFQLNSFNIGGLTPNQKSVARNLDVAMNDSAAAPLINFLGLEALGNLPHDYDLIAPEELASIYEIGFSQAMVQNNNLQRRMDDIRAGSNGFCANGFTPQVSGKDYTKEADGKASLPDKSTRDVYTPSADNRWGVFVTGSGDFVTVSNDDFNARGYDITTGNFTVGADYRLCDHFAIGIDAGYSRSTADLVDNGRVDVDGGKIGAYATVFGKGLFGSKFYIDGSVGGGMNDYDMRRTGLQDVFVRGNTDGTEFNAMISYGSDWTFGCFNVGTWSTVQYTNVSIDEFTETGSLAPLEIQDQDENSFRATTGVRASYDIKAGHFLFRPEVRVAYQHEYCDSAYQVDSRLASGAGDIFRVRGPNIGRDAALVGAGMSMQWNNRLSTYVYYDGVLGRNNYDNNAVSGGFRIGF
jgi:outer membrane autotransporter protein